MARSRGPTHAEQLAAKDAEILKLKSQILTLQKKLKNARL